MNMFFVRPERGNAETGCLYAFSSASFISRRGVLMLRVAVVFFPFHLKKPKKPCSKKRFFFDFVVLAYFF